MLDIIITHYKEPFEVGEKLLTMIGLQRCIDFEQIRVLIVHDGTPEFDSKLFEHMPYQVEQVAIEHGGVSKARNAGIDHATGKWIMFCDFDDSFASIFSLREVMNVLSTDDYDMLWSRILAEDYVEGKQLLYYVPDKQRFVFCHGKVYRTEFLKESGIRFREELVFNEDSCFNACMTNSGREDEASYGHFRRNLIVTGEYEGTEDKRLFGMVTRTTYDAYYMVMGKRNSMQMRRRILDEFGPWIADRIEMFGKVDDDELDEIRDIARIELLEPGEVVHDSHEQIRNWVNGVVKVVHGTDVDAKAR